MFERKESVLSSLDVGQRKLIKDWLDETGVRNYMINDDLTIDVDSVVDLSRRNLKKFPYYIQFNNIKGKFDMGINFFTSLKGCPRIVAGEFECDRNRLTSLEWCPKIAGHFFCQVNYRIFSEEEIRKHCDVYGKIIS